MNFIKDQIKAILSIIVFLIFIAYLIIRQNPELLSGIITSFQDGTWVTYGIIIMFGIAVGGPILLLLRWLDFW